MAVPPAFRFMMHLRKACLAFISAVMLACLLPGPARTVEPVIPNFWDSQERFIRPNLKGLPRLRFLTVTDFPPFSFIDGDNRLAGFHIDLARAICTELEVLPVCQIQALPFAQLNSALKSGQGEAIIAGLPMRRETRRELLFSRPYFHIPGRFVVRLDSDLRGEGIAALNQRTVGVISDTAHAAYARSFFENTNLRLYPDRTALLAGLQSKQVDAVFADALSLAFFLQGDVGQACCRFWGGPYLSNRYFGEGLAIAVPKDSRDLAAGLDYALRSINDKGIFAELYLRYFPISLF